MTLAEEKVCENNVVQDGMKILDSGARREFGTGAVRDIADDKGRCDLLPLEVLGLYYSVNGKMNELFMAIDRYIRKGNTGDLFLALDYFNEYHWHNSYTMMLEASHQYQDGAKKYAERNWEKGIPIHCFLDSGIRHYLKFLRGDTDEPHDRAFVWNILCAIWTHLNKKELIDLPFNETVKYEKENVES